jgi:N-acetylmuramoyl-L-alanine amidase
MRNQAVLAAILTAATLTGTFGAGKAFAEIGASGTRLAVAGGPTRAYMTYGHTEEPELYAPIMTELRRLQISFQKSGEDYVVFHKGLKVAEWPIVRSRDDVPETGEHPCVLVLGGSAFLPVRALSELLPVDVVVDKKENLVALVPGAPRAARTAQKPAPNALPAGQPQEALSVLTGIEVQGSGGTIQVRVRSTEPIRPRVVNLQHLANAEPRVALDFPGARWEAGIQIPAGAGSVTGVRTGQFNETTARLVLDLSSRLVKVTALSVTEGEIVASVSAGRQVQGAKIDPTLEAKIRAIERRRDPRLRLSASRGGFQIGSRRLDPSTLPGGSLTGKIICVDAGHGGHSSGAKGLSYLEKDLCLQMSLEFKQELERLGATVIMPRTSDVFVSLEGRCDFANSHGADIFVSIHCNSMPRRNLQSGSETYYYTPQSGALAEALHPRLVGAVQGRDGGIRANRGFYVIRKTEMPSVLLEIAYINHTDDEQLLANSEFHGGLAKSLAYGVLEYFNGR